MRITFKRFRKFHEVEAYISEVLSNDLMKIEDREQFAKDLIEDYRKDGFIVVVE